MISIPLRLFVSAASVFMLSGCISGSATSDTGIRIGDETLKQFQVGVTTEAWLTAILGPPSSEAAVQGVENTRVLRYATGETTSGLGAILSSSSSKTTAVTYFIVSDGIVTRFWSDRATEYTLMGTPVEQPAGGKLEK
ncbi:MAG: hypothetical protein H7210_08205 [Pyrinomonadaceae bacterium]|nr:hypothetical protein [Phycisphaerales bacterium]